MNQLDEQWILCPACGAKTHTRLLPNTSQTQRRSADYGML